MDKSTKKEKNYDVNEMPKKMQNIMNNGVQIFRDNLFMNEAYTFILIKIELKALNEYFVSFFSSYFFFRTLIFLFLIGKDELRVGRKMS